MLLDCGTARLLRVPWIARGSNQSILKEILNIFNINTSWILIGRTDAEATILRPHDAESWLIWKDPDAGKDWGQKEKGATEDEMTGWHHRLNREESEQTPGDGEGQGSLLCCSPLGHKSQRHDLATEKQHNAIFTLQSIKSAIVLCLKNNNVHTLI